MKKVLALTFALIALPSMASDPPDDIKSRTETILLHCAPSLERMTELLAETWGETNSFDVVTCMFATHEMPRAARLQVLSNARRIARKKVIFVDIDPNYTPSQAMLEGEPYVLEYRKNIDIDFRGASRKEVMIEDHVKKWEFDL